MCVGSLGLLLSHVSCVQQTVPFDHNSSLFGAKIVAYVAVGIGIPVYAVARQYY